MVLFHASGLLRGGYLGVDLFFVLSGYLITSLLFAEQEGTGRVDLRAFWKRRARRLLPALFVLVPAVAIYAKLAAQPEELRTIRGDALATLAYVANWRAIYAHKTYWEIFAAPSPLEHTWSLAIEEQFYVVWPLVVGLALRARRAQVLALSLVLAALSALSMVLLWDPERVNRAYMGSDTRAAAILVGAALAAKLTPALAAKLSDRAVRTLDAIGLACGLALLYAWATLDGKSARLYHGGFWATEIAALSLIACAVCGPRSLVARALATKPLRWLGAISYGVYLWHWPVFVVMAPTRVHLSPAALELVRVAVTLAVALLSFHFVERPIRTRGLPGRRPITILAGATALTLFVVVWATRAPLAAPLAVVPKAASSGEKAVARAPLGWDSVPSNVLPAASELDPGTLRILVLGDSVALFLGNVLRLRQGDEKTFVAQRGVGQCTIHEAEVRIIGGQRVEGTSCADTWTKDVRELRPDVTFIVLGGGFLGPRTCKPDWRERYEKRLSSLIVSMGPDAGKVMVALVPYPMGRWRDDDIVEKVDCFNASLQKVADAQGAAVVDVKSHVCPTPACLEESRGMSIRPDGLHFVGPGSDETGTWTLGEIRRQLTAHDR